MRNLMIVTGTEAYGTRLSRELGRILGAEWQCGYFSDFEKMEKWCGNSDTVILYEEEEEITGCGDSNYLYVPLLSERPETSRLRFEMEERNYALPGLFRYRQAEQVADDVRDIYTVWDMRRHGMRKGAVSEECTETEAHSEEVQEELGGERDEKPRKWEGPACVCVLSPLGGSGVTTFAGALAREYGKTERTVLLSFDPYSAEYGDGQDISEVLYRMEEYGDPWEEDFGLCSRPLRNRFLSDGGETELWSGPRVVAGVAAEEDLWFWEEEAWNRFLGGMERLSVKRLVVDLGPGIMATEALLRNAERCVLIGESGNPKVRNWLRMHGNVVEKTGILSMAEIPAKGGPKRPSPEKKAEEYVRGMCG